MHYLVTPAPRFGFAWGRFLPYVTAEWLLATSIFRKACTISRIQNTRIVGEKAQTNVSWMMGGGLQYALPQRWSVRVSNSRDCRSHHDASLTEHNASFALIYQF